MADDMLLVTVARLGTEIDALRRELAVQHAADERALRLQAQEYERRLDTLNHAHQQAQDRNAEFVRMGEYNVAMREYRQVNEELRLRATTVGVQLANQDKAIAAIEASIQWMGRLVVSAIVIAVVGAVAGGLRWLPR